MNKIRITEDYINILKTDNFITLTNNNIFINNDTEIELLISETNDYQINIEVKENVNAYLFILNQTSNSKVTYKITLNENSHIKIDNFMDSENLNCFNDVYLNGKMAVFEYNTKTIARTKTNFEFNIYHNSPKTKSIISNKGVSVSLGSILYKVNASIPKGIKNCETSQYNHIINLNDEKNIIEPNLFVDEEDVIANHSAYIGKFDEEVLFYLETRGLSLEEATNLLIRGFLYLDNPLVNEILDKYWEVL